MCLGVPGKVIEIHGNKCTVDIMGVSREISIDFVKDVKIGDYLVIHAGCAIQKLDEEEAQNTLRLFEELEELSHG